MSRIKLHFPSKILATIVIPVRITDLNYGRHVGNDAIVSIIHEARVAWLTQHNLSEMDIGGSAIIMNELVVNYQQESFYGDVLSVHIGAGDLSNSGFELFYQLECTRDGKIIPIAIAKTGIRCFNYDTRKISTLPEKMRILLQTV